MQLCDTEVGRERYFLLTEGSLKARWTLVTCTRIKYDNWGLSNGERIENSSMNVVVGIIVLCSGVDTV